MRSPFPSLVRSLVLGATLLGGSAWAATGDDAAPAPAPAATPAPADPGPENPLTIDEPPDQAELRAAAPAPATVPAASPADATASPPASDPPKPKTRTRPVRLAIDQLPDAVKSVFRMEAPEASQAIQTSDKSGVVIFRARYTDKEGTKMVLTVGEDGTLISKVPAKRPKSP